ncbi:MAG: hypothetical protein ABIT20_24710 [Gemmatimonadaceae bacterium]
MAEEERDNSPMSDADAAWLIERAAQLDAAEGTHTKVARLREASHEAGISSAAFERALMEVRLSPPPGQNRVTGLSEITRRVLGNFLPGWLTTLIVPVLVLKPSTFLEIGPIQIGLLTIAAAASVAGHAAALLLLRGQRRVDPRIASRVSFIVGALSPVAFVTLQITGVLRGPHPYDRTALVWAAISAALTVVGYGAARFAAFHSSAKSDAVDRVEQSEHDQGPWARFVAISNAAPSPIA